MTVALGYLALSQADRLFLAGCNHDSINLLGPISGKGQLATLLAYVRSLRYGGSVDLVRSLRQLGASASMGGLTYILSDFFGVERLGEALEYLPSPAWDVTSIQLLHPWEIEPESQGMIEMVDIESEERANYDLDEDAIRGYKERLNAWMTRLDAQAIEHHSFFTTIPTDWSLEGEIIPHMRALHMVRSI
jgi:hypothetical protein